MENKRFYFRFLITLLFGVLFMYAPTSVQAVGDICQNDATCCTPPQSIIDGGGCPVGKYWIGPALGGKCTTSSLNCADPQKFSCSTGACTPLPPAPATCTGGKIHVGGGNCYEPLYVLRQNATDTIFKLFRGEFLGNVVYLPEGVTCNANETVGWDGTKWACGKGGKWLDVGGTGPDIYYNTGKVGIGTIAPIAALDVVGSGTIGAFNSVAGTTSLAIGTFAHGTGNYSLAVGTGNPLTGGTAAYGNTSVVIGFNNTTGCAAGSNCSTATTTTPDTTWRSYNGLNNDGEFAVALGSANVATGKAAVALGGDNRSTGYNSFAAGYQNWAQHDAAIALGNQNHSTAQASTAIGRETNATADFATSLGYLTTASSNAAVAFGHSSRASGQAAIAGGYNSEATKNGSVAIGYQTHALSDYSTALGFESRTTGLYAFASGYYTSAVDVGSTAMGYQSYANGLGAMALGYQSTTNSNSAVAIGFINRATGDGAISIGSRMDFSGANGVGIGLGSAAKSVFSPGNMVIMGGNVGIGNSTPTYELEVTGRINIDRVNSPALYVADKEALWTDGTTFSWGYGGLLNYFNKPIAIGVSNANGYTFRVHGTAAGNAAWSNLSDERLKKNIRPLEGGLDKVSKLRGVEFEWKDASDGAYPDGRQIGFISQEVKEVLPEIVSQGEDGYYSMSTSQITAVLVEAVKELKAENDTLKERVTALENK